MTYYLWELLRDAYQELGQLKVAKATGGSTSTVVDTKLAGAKDNVWNGGTVIVLEDAGGAGAAPEGEFGRVSDYVDSTGTLTIETVTAAVASGDLYGLVSSTYPLYNMIELANQALRELGEVPLVDTTTLDTATDQTEYTYAVTWKRRPPFRVDIQTNTGDANDNKWERVHWWDYVPAAPGSTGLIVFDRQPTASRDLRVWYMDRHTRINAYNDVISEGIAPVLAVAALVKNALGWKLSQKKGGDRNLDDQLKRAGEYLESMKRTYPIWMPPQQAKSRFAGR